MKKRLGICVLIGGFVVFFLAIAATFFWAPHTRSGSLCLMILKATDIKNAFLVSSVACVAGIMVAFYALVRLLFDSEEDEPLKTACENNDDEN